MFQYDFDSSDASVTLYIFFSSNSAANFAWLKASSCLPHTVCTCSDTNRWRRYWGECCPWTPSHWFCTLRFINFSWDSWEPLSVFWFYLQRQLLFIVAGDIIEGDSCKLVHFLVISRDEHFLVDYFFCLLEEVDGFVELDCVGDGVTIFEVGEACFVELQQNLFDFVSLCSLVCHIITKKYNYRPSDARPSE